MTLDILLPAMGEGVIEATITQILAKVGTEIEEDDSIFEIATDKVDSEIPAPENGIISEIFVEEGDVVKVGQRIAVLQVEGEASENKMELTELVSESMDSPVEKIELNETDSLEGFEERAESKIDEINYVNAFLSPLVKSIIKKENITSNEINQIIGTGLNNRITKDDILDFLKNRNENTPALSAKKEVVKEPAEIKSVVSMSAEDEVIEMDRMRKLIAEYMVKSVQTAPHVTSFVESDLTVIVNWRNKNKDLFLQTKGEKLTFMPIIVEAMVKAIKDFPMINVSIDGNNIIKKKNINIGMAAALPSGNLIVPVIKNADEKNLVGLAKQINDLANRSRINKLQPDEIQGSTITITNLGSFGNIAGTPIINQPNVAILAIGAIIKKPAVIETPEGDTIGIRHKMMLSLAYDHRVVDGALGGMFLKRVSDYLEAFDTNRTL